MAMMCMCAFLIWYVHECECQAILQNPNLTKFYGARRIIRSESHGASTAATHSFSLTLVSISFFFFPFAHFC